MKPFFNFNKVGEELRAACIILALALVALGGGLVGGASAAIIINAPMTDTNSAGWVLGGNPTSALLTGNGVIDPVGQGWLRLTSASGNQTGFAYNTTTFDLSAGLLIEFDYATWGGNGADGYSVYLFDAGVSTFNIGAFGGSLGYAQKLSTAACNPVTPSVAGISGGYVGIGVDEFGNFAYGCEGRYLGASQQPNTVTIRGSVVGFGGGAIGSTTGTTSYPWIATSGSPGSLWYNGTPRPSQTGVNYRKVRIQISPAPNPVANVWVAFGYNSPLVYTQMITNQALPAISTSQQLMMGYAASTGGSTNYHEIRNLLVSNQTTTSAIDLAITKTFTDVTSGSTTTASVGDTIQYTVIAANTGPNNVTANGVGIQDTVPSVITGVTWTCTATSSTYGTSSCGAASGSGNTINTTANLPLNGYVTYTIRGTVSAPAPSMLTNTASLVIPGSITDYNSNNNSATVSFAVNNNFSTSTKAVADLNNTLANASPGDTLQYTITLKETAGVNATGVTVTDNMPANVTNFTIVSEPTCSDNSLPTGGTNGTGYLNLSNITVPANGSVTIVFTVTIASSAVNGTTISNTATITPSAGTGGTPAAGTVTVNAASGNKPLYLYDNTSTPTHKLSRTKPTGLAGTVPLTKGGQSQVWTLNPALQSNDTINANVPVYLYLASNAAGSRTVVVTLACGGTTLTQTQTLALTTTAALKTFTLPLGAALTCASNWALTVQNTTAGGGTLNVIVSPMSGTNNSYVNLPSQNVININSVTAYNASYLSGGGTALSSFTTGTIYVRAVVSDPFGSYDIVSLPTLTITDPTSANKVMNVPMPLVNDSGAATKTFEYAFMPTAPAASGNWSAAVRAWEGTEGAISDSRVGTFKITPSLSVLKSAQTYSDPYNGTTNPKAIPGAMILYTVQVTNSSYGSVDANTTVITDPIPTNTSMCVSTLCSNPVMGFTCSASPVCGLTGISLTYSNNSGVSYGYTPAADSNGYDSNVTNIQITPSGTFNGAPSPQSTIFSVTFKVKIK